MDRRTAVASSKSAGAFLDAYFNLPGEKCVIQVGANDGIMCDPLRRYLAKDRNIRAVLIEPIPFYFESLKQLYADHKNISVVNAACGATVGLLPIHFIDPTIANRMNGEGPPNDWAHGQGSFDPKIVSYWIERNKFRGDDYVKNLDLYHSSVLSIDANVIRLGDIEMSRNNENLLIVIDVQGFEFDVIQGIDWNYPPAYLLLEDDMRKSGPIAEYLGSRGYTFLCGRNDKVYMRN